MAWSIQGNVVINMNGQLFKVHVNRIKHAEIQSNITTNDQVINDVGDAHQPQAPAQPTTLAQSNSAIEFISRANRDNNDAQRQNDQRTKYSLRNTSHINFKKFV